MRRRLPLLTLRLLDFRPERRIPIRPFRTFTLAAALAAATGCADSGPEPAPERPLGAPFRLAVGEAARVGPERLEVRFTALAEDSRCPADEPCPEPGNAAVTLVVEAADGGTATLTLNTDRPPLEVGAFGHALRLESVEPAPPAPGAAVDSAAYVATLRVERE